MTVFMENHNRDIVAFFYVSFFYLERRFILAVAVIKPASLISLRYRALYFFFSSCNGLSEADVNRSNTILKHLPKHTTYCDY